MSDTYYVRLTLVNPRDLGKMDPSLGQIIAETATTGKFFISDVVLEQAVAPNKDTLTAYNIGGELKIHEPLGFRMLDYIRWASLLVGCDNHLDARYLLEIELIGDQIEDNDSSFRYIWPIMLLETNVQGSVNEKGTEYNIKFCHSGHHSQTSMVQPLRETKSIDAANPKEYFTRLGRVLELQEFEYAKARQKAGSTGPGGGDHPAASDPYHDEYHFILDPEIENLTFTTKGRSDAGVSRAWTWAGLRGNEWSISAKSGTTIIDQVNKVLSQIKDIASLYMGRNSKATPDATGSSDANKKSIEASMGEIYKFFRTETHTVYKEFDYIRGRYAVKHVFIIYLADQPNLYQYPDEIDMLNDPVYEEKVITKLRAYIQQGLLRKSYFHMYTGMNTEVIKVDFQLNQAYFLPSFPVVWADRGTTSDGPMNPQNYSKRVLPYVHAAKTLATKNKINDLQNQNKNWYGKLNDPGKKLSDSEKKRIQKTIETNEKLLADRRKELETSWREVEADRSRATFAATDERRTDKGTRQQTLQSYTGLYVEDDKYEELMDMLFNYHPALRPRMEPDEPISALGEVRDENERLMEKIFAVQLGARDLQELELEVFADPYWLGQPNMIMAGKKYLDRLAIPDSLKKKINEVMPNIDTNWAGREPRWGDYDQATYYSGSNMFYFNAQIPTNDGDDDDLMKFGIADQIIGIYVVKVCRNEFKDGKWTQKLSCIRDSTIPSKFLPRATGGTQNWEEFVLQTINDPVRAVDEMQTQREAEKIKREQAARAEQVSSNKNTGQFVTGAGGAAFGNPNLIRQGKITQTAASDAAVRNALDIAKAKLAANPPPPVSDPTKRAQELVDSGVSRDQAYATAKTEFINSLKAYNKHVSQINRDAYAEAGVKKYQPYSEDTLTGLVVSRSGSGGLDDWKSGNTQKPGSWSTNNPGGLGFDSNTGTYNGYSTYQDGIQAVNDYYNYGVGVPAGRSGTDKFLLPKNFSGSVFGSKTELDYILVKSVGVK